MRDFQLNQYLAVDISLFLNDKKVSEKWVRCVGRYSKPHSFKGKLHWSAYRVWNTVKHIFGRSDRQMIVKLSAKNWREGWIGLHTVRKKNEAKAKKLYPYTERVKHFYLLFDYLIKANEKGISNKKDDEIFAKKVGFNKKNDAVQAYIFRKQHEVDKALGAISISFQDIYSKMEEGLEDEEDFSDFDDL